ncbi:MAG: Rrf2 family transcriptional regulator [Alphaproteobacteria bacterium]
MKMTTKGRYAVLAMVDIARHKEGGITTLAEISQRRDISLSYLEQLFSKLRRAGVVESVRGPGGGYRFARSAKEITALDIMRAVEEPVKETFCEKGSRSACVEGGSDTCLTKHFWRGLGNHIEGYLAEISLDDIEKGTGA